MSLLRRSAGIYRSWAQRTKLVHRPLYYILNGLIIAIGFGIIIQVPAEVLLIVSRKFGRVLPSGREVLLLTVRTKIVMVGSLVLVTIVSGALAGLVRALCRGGIYGNWWSLLGWFTLFGALFLYIGYVARQITGSLTTVTGDTPIVLTYLTAWLLLLGYVAKVPWDEYRDRCASFWERKWDLCRYWDVAQTEKATLAVTASSQVSDGKQHRGRD